jgi:hypothetical protein
MIENRLVRNYNLEYLHFWPQGQLFDF